MKRISATSAALSALLAAPLLMVSAVRAEAAVDFGADVSLGFHVGDADVNVFYDSLAPYGDWVDTGRYGLCWAPRVTEQDWRPYYYGHWIYTDYGWTWASDEEWGWGPYHYGRWAFDPAYGWVWVPGSVWAPAWVAWRWGDGYAGWAPLPPEVDPSMGPANLGIDPLSFVFVQDRYVADPVLVDRYVPRGRNVTIVNVTRNVTNYTVVDNRVVNNGVPLQQVERVTGRAVPRVRIAEQAAPAPTRVRGNEIAIYRPTVPKASATARPGTATPQHPMTQRPAAATQRPPAAAPPSTTDPAELKRKHAEEQQALQAREAQEREKLRQIHEQEKAAPPSNVSQQQLEQRHQAEARAQAEHEQRQKQALEERQARERKAAQQAQQQRQGHQQAQNEKQKNEKEKKNEKDKKKPENKQQ